MPLTTVKARHAKPGRHADGHGLYLFVRDSGARSWVLRIQYGGHRRDFGLGALHDVSLADARSLAAELRKRFRAGLDPTKPSPSAAKDGPTFEQVARDCYEAVRGGWKDRRHASWMSSFERHVFPQIGAKPIGAVESSTVLEVLEPVWLAIPDTAKRILQRIGSVLDYAHIKGLVPAEVSRRSVTRGLPRQTRAVSHRAAMPYADVPDFMASLTGLPPTLGRDALKLTILTAVRSNETRGACWSEFDLERAVWSIPAARMKMQEPHLVPLSAAAVGLLRRLWARSPAVSDPKGERACLFSFSSVKPISDMTMLKVLRDMNVCGATVHGFRSSFTDWAAEQTNVPKEVADKALAHRIPNAVEAAYRRTDFFEKRRALMTAWSEYVTGAPSAMLRGPENPT